MTDDTVLRLTLRGLSNEGGHVRLSDFLRELQLFGSALRQYDRFSSGGQLSSYLRVVELSHNSPATVALQAQPRKTGGDTIQPARIIREFFDTVRNIQEHGELPAPIDLNILKSLQKMTEPAGRSLAEVEICQNGLSVPLDFAFGEKVTKIMMPEESYSGAMPGMLEAINVHGGANVFSLFPDFGPDKITCHFGKAQQELAISAVGRFVTIHGTMRRRVNAYYPHAAFVERIEIMPPEADLPTFWALRGIAPELTGDVLSETWVREHRNAADI
jgi:hypothetical protein